MWIPYKYNIIVKPKLKDDILAGDAKYESYGEVIAIGSKVDPNDINVGDTVGFDSFGIKEIPKDGESIFVFKDDSDFILAIEKKQ